MMLGRGNGGNNYSADVPLPQPTALPVTDDAIEPPRRASSVASHPPSSRRSSGQHSGLGSLFRGRRVLSFIAPHPRRNLLAPHIHEDADVPLTVCATRFNTRVWFILCRHCGSPTSISDLTVFIAISTAVSIIPQVAGERPALRMGNVKAVYQIDPPTPPSKRARAPKRPPLFAALLPCCYVAPVHEAVGGGGAGRGGVRAAQPDGGGVAKVQDGGMPGAQDGGMTAHDVQPVGVDHTIPAKQPNHQRAVRYVAAHHSQAVLFIKMTGRLLRCLSRCLTRLFGG